MNPKAALFAFLTLLAIFPLESQAQIVPWRAVKNTIFGTPDEQSSQYFCGGGIEAANLSDCLGIGDSRAMFSTLEFRASTNSTPIADPNSAALIWQSHTISEQAGTLKNRGIVRYVEDERSPSARVVVNRNARRARIGQTLQQGDSIKSRGASRVDIFLGENGPVLQLDRNTDLEIACLELNNTGLYKIIDTRLHLRAGRITGNVKKLAPQSIYLIRTQNNLIRIRGTEYQIDADGSCAIVSGSAEVITPTHIHTVHAGEKFTPETSR